MTTDDWEWKRRKESPKRREERERRKATQDSGRPSRWKTQRDVEIELGGGG